MTAVPRTARALTDLSEITPSDASILLVREGTTDGRANLEALALQILGVPLAACIGGSADTEAHALTSSAWTPVVYSTGAAVLSRCGHDGQGQITADLGAGETVWARVSWQIHVETTGSVQILATTYLAGAAAGVTHRARVTSAGQVIVGACIVQISHGETVQVALRRLAGSGSVDVTSLAIQIDYIPRVTPV